MYFREFLNLFRAGRAGQGKERKARRKKFRQPKRGRGGRGVWGEFRLARAEAKPRRPARSGQRSAKKFSFPFRGKNRARAKSKNAKKTFLLDSERSERRRGGASVSFKEISRKV